MLTTELTEEEFAEEAREDLDAAIRSRHEIERRKLRVYKAYEVWSDKVVGGGKLDEFDGGVGEFGWSQVQIPMLYWIVETELPRLALGAPTLVAAAKSPKAVPFTRAKTLRLQCEMRDADARPAIFRSVKRMSLYGLGPMVAWWNADEGRMALDDVSWFDFFISPEARRWQDAEVLWVRSWWTARQLRRMAKRKDHEGKPLYRNVEDVIDGSGDPSHSDQLWQTRREIHGQGSEQWSENGVPLPLYTGYYQDGSVIILGGTDYRVVVQNRVTPYWRRIPLAARARLKEPYTDKDGVTHGIGDFDPRMPTMVPFRPIVCLGNTPDTEGPYPTGSGEVVLTYQEEMSTIRRQALDQATAHLNAPVVYDKAALGEDANAKIDQAFGAPGGKLAVNAGSDLRNAVMRLQPGQLNVDVQALSDMFRQEAQLVTGISDYVAGLASQNGVGSNTTATAVQRITDEANMRWRLKNALIEDDMQHLARIVEWCDRLFGPASLMHQDDGYRHDPETLGVTDHGGGLVEVGSEFNGDDYEYEVRIEAGSLTPPSQSQELQDLMQFVNMAIAVPDMQVKVNWAELIRDVVGRFGYDPDRMLIDDAAVAAKVAAEQAPEGMEPVGQPVPVA